MGEGTGGGGFEMGGKEIREGRGGESNQVQEQT